MQTVELIDQTDDWLTYDLPPELVGKALKGRFRGQKQKWFVFRFIGEEAEINIESPPDGAPVEFDAWEWVAMAQVPERIVAFKRPIYEELARRFAHHAS